MLGDIYAREVGVFVYRRADDTAEAGEDIKLCLKVRRDLRDKRFSAEKLKHIPKVSEDYRKHSLEELRRVAVEKIDYAPYQKQSSAGPPNDHRRF